MDWRLEGPGTGRSRPSRLEIPGIVPASADVPKTEARSWEAFSKDRHYTIGLGRRLAR